MTTLLVARLRGTHIKSALKVLTAMHLTEPWREPEMPKSGRLFRVGKGNP